MSYGLNIWRANGDLCLSVTDYLTTYLGVVDTYASTSQTIYIPCPNQSSASHFWAVVLYYVDGYSLPYPHYYYYSSGIVLPPVSEAWGVRAIFLGY